MRRFFTSESVTEGHPDKIADQISDAILDDILANDPNGRVACETICTTGMVMVFGEISTTHYVDLQKVVRDTVKEIGYVRGKFGFDADNLAVLSAIDPQSPDIAMGVDESDDHEQGAGDQGIMFGYATNETEGYMPLAISIAHKLVRTATILRKEGKFKGARPDMKSQVTIDYTNPDNIRVDTVLMSCSHDEDVDLDAFRKYIHEEIMEKVIASFGLNIDFKYYINPTGRFVIGGPKGDTGLTGRKIIVDTYGGTAEHGGGAFSGKDPSKVDRSAAYYTRYIAKNLVAAGVADRLQVQVSYGIGIPEPLSVAIKTYHTAHYPDSQILEIIREVFDLRPGMIIKNFNLKKPTFKYADVANYGHLGRPDLDLPWEKLDKVEQIKKMLGIL